MPTDDHIISQFVSVNNNLANIQSAIQETNRAVGEIKGEQRAQAASLRRVERRLDDSNSETRQVVEDLKIVTSNVQNKLHSIVPKVEAGLERNAWLRKAFSPENVKMALLIIASIVAVALGVSFPFLS